jgi:glycosyltransferase involved in cell wall biosynthesis
VTRIALYTDSTTLGGAEAVVGTLLAALDPGLEVVLAGVDATVLGRLATRRPGLRTAILPRVGGKAEVAALLSLARAIRGLNADVFQANLPVPSSCQYALAAAALVPRLRSVALEHLPYPLDGRWQLTLKRVTSARLAAHVAVGEQVARRVETLARLPSGSIRTIHNGVDDVELEPRPRLFDGPTLGSIGRLDRQKGYDVLLRALAELPAVSLVLVGDGPERGALEPRAADGGAGARVRFAGWDPAPRHWLTAIDVFVLPSRFEGLPLAIVEAMLARRAVVATDVGSVAEAVEHQVTGLLVAPEQPLALAHALRTLLEHPQNAAAMGAAGRERARRFTPAAMARAYERLYEEIAP